MGFGCPGKKKTPSPTELILPTLEPSIPPTSVSITREAEEPTGEPLHLLLWSSMVHWLFCKSDSLLNRSQTLD